MNTTALFGSLLAAILVAIAWVDWRKMVIPDLLNVALGASGIAYQVMTSPEMIWMQIIAGLAVFLAFWSIRRVHSKMTGRLGLGLGDVKMAGASAIWISPWNLPIFVFASSFTALVFAFGHRLFNPHLPQNVRKPFGPFLAAGLLLTWAGERQFS